GPTRWTRPDDHANWAFDHEAQHAINQVAPGGILSEVFSSAAEALVGELPEVPRNDVPYTWSLIRGTASGPVAPFYNYPAWREIGAYITYNFRGAVSARPGGSTICFGAGPTGPTAACPDWVRA